MMACSTMERPVTIPAHTNTVRNFKSHVWIIVPCVKVVGRQASTTLSTCCANVVSLFENISSPFTINTPPSFSLYIASEFAFVIPVAFTPKDMTKHVFAFLRASALSSIGLICNILTTYFTSKLTVANSFVGRGPAKTKQSHVFHLFGGSLYTYIPNRAYAFTKMSSALTRNAIKFHPIPNRTATNSIQWSNVVRRKSLNHIQVVQSFFTWSGGFHFVPFIIKG